MRTVWKVELEAHTTSIDLVEGIKPLCVQIQNKIPCLWVEVDNEKPNREYQIVIIGTGHPIPPGHWTYIGTFQIIINGLVFHVYMEI